MITQRRKSDVFSFTLSKCLKENIAVDLEKKKRGYNLYHLLCGFTTHGTSSTLTIQRNKFKKVDYKKYKEISV